jgi:hypothetical protein
MYKSAYVPYLPIYSTKRNVILPVFDRALPLILPSCNIFFLAAGWCRIELVGVLDVVTARLDAVVPVPWSSRSPNVTTTFSYVYARRGHVYKATGYVNSMKTLKKSAKWMLGHTNVVGRCVCETAS